MTRPDSKLWVAEGLGAVTGRESPIAATATSGDERCGVSSVCMWSVEADVVVGEAADNDNELGALAMAAGPKAKCSEGEIASPTDANFPCTLSLRRAARALLETLPLRPRSMLNLL